MKNSISTYYLFFDTEFANFNTLPPLSVGIVTEDKQFEFYKEVNDFDPNLCSNFVHNVVIPLMDLPNHGMPYKELSQAIIKWINELPCKDVIFVADYMGDVVIVERMLSLPGELKLEKKVVFKLIDKALIQAVMERGLYDHRTIHKAFKALTDGIDASLVKTPAMQHHALYDANANLDGWISAINVLKK
jgi:hypothetical protein